MPRRVEVVNGAGLERSCRGRDWIRFGPSSRGVERAEVRLSTHAYEPHRHDTYAIGITTAGVQVFRYRGSHRVCLPGQLHILHPDERHDGAPGTDDGFAYRILYVAPQLVRQALDWRALPFVADPVQELTQLTRPIADLLANLDEPISDLAEVELAVAVADALVLLGGGTAARVAIDLRAVELVRDHLAAHAQELTPASRLEAIAGTDRFTIARHFRRAFGISPDRYRTLRRLALARTAIEDGLPLAEAAADAGFADQSHLTRQFKRAYGLTPGSWRALRAAVV
ncbi:MAG: AraC family transcriptional regulator [Candidatus Dormibacteraeota bacterium]|nr:AraC family transcriptional regulator [Candidatus Dormibacteraeota bacterium]